MEALHALLEAYDDGNNVVFTDGRSFVDLDLGPAADGSPSCIWTLEHGLEVCLRERYGMFLLKVRGVGGGLDWAESTIDDPRDRRTIRTILRAHDLPTCMASPEPERSRPGDAPPATRSVDSPRTTSPDVVAILRGLGTLMRTDLSSERWANGDLMRVAVLVEYVEHLAPAHTAGNLTEQERAAAEILSSISQSLAVRASRNLFIMHGRPGLVNDLITRTAHHVALPQPDAQSKLAFIQALQARYPSARLDDGLTPEALAHATSATPNRGLEARFYASHHQSRAVTTRELMAQKARDIAEMSEGTLRVLDPQRVKDVQLVGRNIAVPAAVLAEYTSRLARGSRTTPMNLLLVGSPGGGKSDAALIATSGAGVAGLELLSPKNPYVGETERMARLQMEILKSQSPVCAWVDEVTESFKMSRHEGGFDGDNGATRSIMGEWLKALSDESRRGRVMIVAATNTPWEMSLAMSTRWEVIPVLRPLLEDMPTIILSLARRISNNAELQIDEAALVEAAGIFDAKFATPRKIGAALAKFAGGENLLTSDRLIAAARDVAPELDRVSSVYADLWAIRNCTYHSSLPWSGEPATYPYPPHIADVVDRTTGEIDYETLQAKIDSYSADAHV